MERKNDVVCIGSAAVDSVFYLEEFPSPDEISLAKWKKEFCGGSSANVAVGLSRLGFKSGLISKVGEDLYGRTLLERLVSEGVDVKAVTISGKTTRTTILVNKAGEKMIIADTDNALKIEEELPQSYIKGENLYIGECFFPVVEKALKLAQSHTFLRVKNVHLSLGFPVSKVAEKAEFVIMNERTYSLMKECRKNFIITKGERGSYYVKEDLTVRGFPVNPKDTTGAGDAFCSGFISKVLEGCSVEEALLFGNAAGAVSTTKYGAMDSMPRREEIELLL